MTKPTWKPTAPTNSYGVAVPGYRFCPCCTWRGATEAEFCASCLAVAAELGGPKPPPPDPPRLTADGFRRHGDPTGILARVDANNAAITAAYLADRRVEAGA
jgi:hypothetical protein